MALSVVLGAVEGVTSEETSRYSAATDAASFGQVLAWDYALGDLGQSLLTGAVGGSVSEDEATTFALSGLLQYLPLLNPIASTRQSYADASLPVFSGTNFFRSARRGKIPAYLESLLLTDSVTNRLWDPRTLVLTDSGTFELTNLQAPVVTNSGTRELRQLRCL